MNNVLNERKKKSINDKLYIKIKNIFDFVSSLVASIILIIPITIIAIIIFIKDPGNPFYFQKRMGQNGKMIKIMKFRSMKSDADNLEKHLTPEQMEEYKKEYKLEDDPRLIGYKKAGDGNKCFGSLIRRLSIDELPQIIYNIFVMKDMSVVGPRPILKEELKKNYSKSEIKEFLSVKPGLTGYWQAYARNNAGYENHKRQDMELYYIHNKSVLLDIKILFRTVIAVFNKEGAK